uniref:Uncharacterized protein n=1 Tax=Panagrolaimus superbus TaxID=310955 RepID=A0A914Y7J5_9BILA
MSSTAKKDLQQMIKRFETRKGDGKYDTAADAAISIAESYNDIGDPENAYKYYEDAKECLTNISEKSYKVLYNEFLAYRRSFEMFCLIEKY